MGTKVNSNYEDLLTFTRASKGHALRPVSYGDELVVNGDFSSTDLSDWTLNGTGPSASVSNGVVTITRGTNVSGITQQVSLTVGNIYKLQATTGLGTASSVTLRSGIAGWTATDYANETGADTHTVIFVATSSSAYVTVFGGASSGDTFTADNISVKEVFFDQPDGTLTLFEHPNNVPRVEYDADGNRLGLLVEEARTNLVQYSTIDSNWSTSTLGTGVTPVVTLNNEAAPDGTTTAAKVVLDVGGGTTSSDRSIFLAPSASVTATNSYAGSVWLKGETGGEQIVMRHAGNATYSLFTLTTSWARYDVTETAASSSATMAIGLKGNQTGQTATIYVYGAQLEEGSLPTSYIKTTGSTATRSADVASIPVADFGYNQSAGTLFAVAQNIAGNTTDPRVVVLSDGTSDNRIRIDVNDGNNIRMTVTDGGVVQTSAQNTFNDYDSQYKVAFAFKENDFKLLVNNSVSLTDSVGTVPDGITTVYVGSNFNGGGGRMNGHIKSIKYYPRRLSDAQLVELTS